MSTLPRKHATRIRVAAKHLIQAVLQGCAGDVLHHEVRHAVGFVHVVDGDHIIMSDFGGRPGLAQESFAGIGVVRLKDLHRHHAMEAGIEGFQDKSHAAPADDFADLIMSQPADLSRLVRRQEEVEWGVGRGESRIVAFPRPIDGRFDLHHRLLKCGLDRLRLILEPTYHVRPGFPVRRQVLERLPAGRAGVEVAGESALFRVGQGTGQHVAKTILIGAGNRWCHGVLLAGSRKEMSNFEQGISNVEIKSPFQ